MIDPLGVSAEDEQFPKGKPGSLLFQAWSASGTITGCFFQRENLPIDAATYLQSLVREATLVHVAVDCASIPLRNSMCHGMLRHCCAVGHRAARYQGQDASTLAHRRVKLPPSVLTISKKADLARELQHESDFIPTY